jgi:hypothetical protein
MPNKKKEVRKKYTLSAQGLKNIEDRSRNIEYMMLVLEEDGVCYYVSNRKKIYKSIRDDDYDKIIKVPVTEEDYKKIDVEYWYNEKYTKWRQQNIKWWTSY